MLGSGIAMWQICCTTSCRIVVSLSVGGVVQHIRSRCPCSGVWHLQYSEHAVLHTACWLCTELFLQGVSIALCGSCRRHVRPSHADTVLKRRKLGSRNLRCHVAPGLQFLQEASSRNSTMFTLSESGKRESGMEEWRFSAFKSLCLRNGARQDQCFY